MQFKLISCTVIALVALLQGCASVPSVADEKIPLAEVIEQVRAELAKAHVEAKDATTNLDLSQVSIVLKVSATRGGSGGGGISLTPLAPELPINLTFSAQGTGTMKNTVTLTYTPMIPSPPTRLAAKPGGTPARGGPDRPHHPLEQNPKDR